MVQNALADAQAFGRDLEQLIRGQEFQAGFQAELGDRGQAQGIVRTEARVLVRCLVLQTLTVMSSPVGV